MTFRYAGRLESEDDIHVRDPDDPTTRDVEQREIRGQLLSHEASAERVDEVVVRGRTQIVLGHHRNAPRYAFLSAEHRHRPALDFAPGEAPADSCRHARVTVAECPGAVTHATSSTACPGEQEARRDMHLLPEAHADLWRYVVDLLVESRGK